MQEAKTPRGTRNAFLFFFNEGNFAQVKNVNRKKIGDGVKSPKQFWEICSEDFQLKW